MFKIPVPPGNHVVVVMDGTGATREQDLPFKVGELQRMDETKVMAWRKPIHLVTDPALQRR